VLFNYLFNQRFILLIQSGFYIDFFLKKICEVFIKNIFIYSSQFFGEKYIIEVLTKKIIDKYILFIFIVISLYEFEINKGKINILTIKVNINM
jgi:hypothetical protein